MSLLETFEALPTGGKVAVGAGVLGVVLVIWAPWKKSTAMAGGIVAPDPMAGIPLGGGGAGGGIDTGVPSTPTTTPTTLPSINPTPGGGVTIVPSNPGNTNGSGQGNFPSVSTPVGTPSIPSSGTNSQVIVNPNVDTRGIYGTYNPQTTNLPGLSVPHDISQAGTGDNGIPAGHPVTQQTWGILQTNSNAYNTEVQRTYDVINNRNAAGQDTNQQTQYLKDLQNLPNKPVQSNPTPPVPQETNRNYAGQGNNGVPANGGSYTTNWNALANDKTLYYQEIRRTQDTITNREIARQDVSQQTQYLNDLQNLHTNFSQLI